MISVVVPVLDGGDDLQLAVRSVLDQTLAELEVLIVDDGSSDDGVERLRALADPRLRFLRTQRLGDMGARAVGVEAARHDLIALMDHDDVSMPRRFAAQVPLLQDPGVSLVGTLYGRMTPAGLLLDPPAPGGVEERTAADFTRGRKPWCDPSALFRKRDLLAVGLHDARLGERYAPTAWWYRLLTRGRCLVLREPLYYHRLRLGSISNGGAGVAAVAMHAAVRRHYDPGTWATLQSKPELDPRSLERKYVTRAVETYLLAGDVAAARRAAAAHLSRAPLGARAWKLALKAALGRPRLRGPSGGEPAFSPAGRWVGGAEPIRRPEAVGRLPQPP